MFEVPACFCSLRINPFTSTCLAQPEIDLRMSQSLSDGGGLTSAEFKWMYLVSIFVWWRRRPMCLDFRKWAKGSSIFRRGDASKCRHLFIERGKVGVVARCCKVWQGNYKWIIEWMHCPEGAHVIRERWTWKLFVIGKHCSPLKVSSKKLLLFDEWKVNFLIGFVNFS